jgi:hypothetical protein
VAASSSGTIAWKGRAFGVATTGNAPEKVSTIQIQRSAKKSRRVVFTIGPKDLPDPSAGSLIEATGEVTLTTTCVDASDRCIGRKYGYSPKVGMRLVLTGKKGATGGRRAVPISGRFARTCSQGRPDRNHHCPLVIEHSKLRVPKLTRLPCKPARCRVNMVVDAADPKARHGDVVVVGADRPGGEIDKRKGRLNAIVFDRGASHGKPRRGTKPVHATIPMGSEGSGGDEVIFSVKVNHLRRGDALLARARQLTDIGHLPYSAFVAGELIVGTKRTSTVPKGLARKAISYHGTLSAVNGFNCTQGRSGYATPCLTRKVGLGKVQRDVINKKGRDVPLFVNLVSRAFPKLATANGGSAIIRDGFVEVRRLQR